MMKKNKNQTNSEMSDVKDTTEQSATQPTSTQEPISTEELVDYETKFNEVNDHYLRLMAEFDNYRKRMMRDRADLIKNASERVVVDLLPIIDNFERSLKSMETSTAIEPVIEGVSLIYQQMLMLLKQQGVSVIETDNQLFNDELHEAVTTAPAASEDMKGKIMDCVQKGYIMNEKVIRFPKVVVGQ